MPKERPESLTGPPDGQTLEVLIGELQSEWGVPQYPQEYRITIKVADEHDARADRTSAPTEPRVDRADSDGGAPKRERAPAAPRVAAAVEREAAPRRRRGRRRRRRGKGGGATSTDAAQAAPSPEE